VVAPDLKVRRVFRVFRVIKEQDLKALRD
jgi:hypothetical protein